ncbi:protein kinase C and casein kinase substrate in neurons protein 3 [Biomphalaria glabrata]|uniref:Protein kinase C and casein kinase substrate in neurons protein 3-like isoform X1 n=1 Tax=Biomphalaria glabrata TaxID=6526 RepID=A0A9W3BMU0_BIOGL|nr:protein kinase C and casein kinase substrate in neurons protein 3-like isoform X1 [Biomphalaria glabrata]XP_055900714.1 protein kinase C and casein kinase substrate in neurons protein 3-like isoform X1 [Biomphalaria glabrata]XP_055900715.1 protein kinase C and casein kinase substrate in neurons protein 3-like isoform X1 [Biomphalaria glabrata]XP_055900716.1 protein kinase C and casein kinase substrate in neurons protein 3-like isoform X1 [Biomphalaria glabrata]XP_055900717.1 protein kinase C
MSVNDDGQLSSSDSFWEVGRYMRTVKRCDNGYQLCNHLRKLIEERNEIEKKYAAMLTEWTKKWNNFLDKGPEYGTTLGAWKGVLTEADGVAELHNAMAEKMMDDVHTKIKFWQKENYHKSMMHFKETKEFEDNFRKAQKPWAKRLAKVVATKKDYHVACKTEKSTANQENNSRADSSVSQEQLKKLQDKLKKCQQEVENTREKYTAALNDLNSYNAKYIEDMTEVYKRSQDFEQKRIDFFKKIFFQLHACLDLSVESRFSQIYTNLHSTIGNVDPNKDLKWWSSTHGVDMGMNWPAFEEYSPELQSISKRAKSNLGSADGGIMITSIKHSREDSYGSYSEQPSAPPPQQQQQQPQNYKTQSSTNSYASAPRNDMDSSVFSVDSLNPFGEYDSEEEEEEKGEFVEEVKLVVEEKSHNDKLKNGSSLEEDPPLKPPRSLESHKELVTETRIPPVPRARDSIKNRARSESPDGENPFGDGDMYDENEEGEEPPSAGWMVRALYDYVRAEDDELEFKAGDVFLQVALEDEMGWCRGKKGEDIGFYPKNYVERI